MPTLEWIGKDKVINHHQDVPYKVLKHKYGFENGKQSENITNTGNKIIHGDNLEALKSLLPEYEGKIKCIYIDPPYNTGNEKWVYNDNVNHPKIKKWLGEVVGKEGEDLSRHDKWLCMMYPRLKLLHKLLREDGVIFISIDDNEQANLKLICDEIFGSSIKMNYIGCIHWKRSESQNNNAKHFSTVGEYILCYTKGNKNNISFNKIELTEKAKKEYRYKDERGFFRRGTIVDNTRGNNIIEIQTPTGDKKTIKSIRTLEWIEEMKEKDLIYWTKTGTPYSKIYLESSEGQVISNWLDNVGVNEDATEELTKMNINFPYSKPYSLINKLINISTDKNAIILDSFASSGTTAHAVLNLNKEDEGNRKFIIIEMENYAESITAERVKRVINGYSDVEGTGGGFDYYELGEPLFISEDILNENIDINIIRQYIFYTETKKTLKTENEKNKYFLGSENNADYYFYYEKEEVTVLNYDFIATLQNKAEQYVIYADKCSLSKEELVKMNIIFKKIPKVKI